MQPPMQPPVPPPPPFGYRPPPMAFRPLPVRRPWWRTWWVVGLILVGTVWFAGAGTLAGLAVHDLVGSPSAVLGDAADGLAKEPALRLRTSVDQDGSVVLGDFTVTRSRYTSGTITDPFSGKASLVATPAATAVKGDQDWWGRRAPDQVSRLKGTWVRPDSGTAYPVDVNAALNPGALAKLVRSLAASASGGTDETVNGQKLTRYTSKGWTLLLTAGSHRLVNLSGKLSSGSMPAVYRGGGRVVPAVGADGPTVVPVQDTGGDAAFSVAPEPEDNGQAKKAEDDASQVLPGGQANPAPSGSGAQPTGQDPPAQTDLPAQQAAFSLNANASDCWSETCSWTVTVTNNGNAPGNASVVASATPGMDATEIQLGTIPAGGSKPTPPMSFANPAPEPAPGQTTSVSIAYSAYVLNLTLDGTSAAVDRRLHDRGLKPEDDPNLNGLTDDYRQGAFNALDQMLTSGVEPDDAKNTIDSAMDQGLTPDVATLGNNPSRVLNWSDLPDQVNAARTSPGRRLELQQGAALLRQDPHAAIILDGAYTDPNTGKKYGSDLFDVPGRTSYQLKNVTGKDDRSIREDLETAVEQLNGKRGPDQNGVVQNTPPGWTRIATLKLNQGNEYYGDNKRQLLNNLRKTRLDKLLCGTNKTPNLERLVIENSTGTYTWYREDFHDFGPACA